MENATKAMLIAAGVLIGMMIVSLGVVLYSDLSSYVESSHERIRFNELNKFNTQFTNYVNYTGNERKFIVTIQDVITVANIAYENNQEYNATVDERGNQNSLYVAVYLDGSPIEHDINEKSQEMLTTELSKNVQSQYQCTVEYSSATARVYKVNFKTVK